MEQISNGADTSAKLICFVVPGAPIGKGRPKFARKGAFVRAYTPEKTASYENLVKVAAAEAMAGAQPLERPVFLALTLNIPIPASWSKKRRQLAVAGLIGATVKPDLDNVCKAVTDAMNGIVYVDDKQIVSATIVKQYATVPHVEVRVSELTEKEAA